MRFICLSYHDESEWESKSPSEQSALIEECLVYDDELRKGGHLLGGEALHSVRNAATLRNINGRVEVTNGPHTESKEHLACILILEARDLNHAIALMSKHPGVRAGSYEIRPANEEFNAFIESRNRRMKEMEKK